MFYLVIAVLCTMLSGYLFKKASGTISLHSPNMMSVIFYLYFIINNVIGAILIVNNVDDHYAIAKLSNDDYRYYGFWTVIYTIIFFPIGQIIANALYKKNNMSLIYYNYINKQLSDEPSRIRKHVKSILILLSCITLISIAYTIITIGGSPLTYLFSGGGDIVDAGIIRADASRNFAGNIYFRNFGVSSAPFFAYIAYGYKRLNNTLVNRWWFWTMFASSILILTYDLEKAPLLYFLLGFVFFRVYQGYRLSNKVLLLIVLFSIGLILLMYLFLSSLDINTMFIFNQGFIGRMTLSSTAGLYLTYDIFPSSHDFLGFTSFSRFLSDIFGCSYSERSARYVMEYVNPAAVSEGTAGVYNSLFVSEAWANWGLIGVVLSPIYVGFVIQCFYLFLLCTRKTPFFLGLFVSYSIRSSINGGINDYIYNVSFLYLLLYFCLLYGFGTRTYTKVKQ